MALPNKYAALCCDCHKTIEVGAGLADKRVNVGVSGSGWLTKHQGCNWCDPHYKPPVASPTTRYCHPDDADHWHHLHFGGATES